MASLDTIRAGIKATLDDALPAITTYSLGEHVASLPAIVATPASADFDVAMGKGVDTWLVDLVVMVSAVDPALAQSQLDGYVSGTGPDSIRGAVFAKRDLGVPNTQAHVSAVTAYNVALSAVEIDHVAATLRLVVHTKGTEQPR